VRFFDSFTKQISIMLLASTLANVCNYLFHFFMGRFLGPSEYGILASLTSVFFIISIPTGTIQTTITKYASNFKAQGRYGAIAVLLSGSIKRLFIVGAMGVIIFTLTSRYIASFLNVSSLLPVVILAISLFFVLVVPSAMGILQGLQKFTYLGLNTLVMAASKLLIGILLVYIGLGVSGAISSYALSYLVALIFTLIPLTFLFKQNRLDDNVKFSEIYRYLLPVFLTILCLTLLTNMDVILVKHFFSSSTAGYYSAASIIAKIIFYLPEAIGIVMFPKISELYSLNRDTRMVLKKSLFYTGFLGGGACLIYFFLPSFIVRLFFGNQYLPVIPLVGIFGLAMYLFSLINILFLYQLSIHRLRFIWLLIASTVLEVILMALFHQSLTQVILILLAIGSLLFVSNSYYLFVLEKEKT